MFPAPPCPYSLRLLGLPWPPDTPRTSGAGLPGGGCDGGFGEDPIPVKLLPPGKIGKGPTRAPPSSRGGGHTAPRPPRHRTQVTPERGYSLSRGIWTPCLFVWSQPPPRRTTPYCSAPPRPHPSSHPGPAPPQPAPGHVSLIDQSAPRMRVTWSEGQGNAGAVKA